MRLCRTSKTSRNKPNSICDGIANGLGDREILESLLSDDRAAHSYIGPRPSPFAVFMDGDPQEPVHGPYVLDRLDADSFNSSTPRDLWSGLEEFVAEWKQPESTLIDLGLDELLLPVLDQSDSVYRLPEQPGKFHRLHAEIETLGSFSEFVVIARASHSVLDVITAQD